METSETPSPKFDDVLRMVGGSGRWQLFLIMWLSKVALLMSFFMMAMIFLGAVPDHRCADGAAANITFDQLSDSAPSCDDLGNTTCARWVYDRSELVSTMTTQWDLVCHRRPLLALVQSLSMLGGLVGALVAGIISDRWGRRPTVLVGCALYAATAAATAMVSDYHLLLATRFVAGLATSVSLAPTVVLVLELLTPEWRLLAGLLIQVPFALGLMLLSALAYLLPTWWHMQLALAAPSLLYVADFWLLPESPRWQVVNGRLAAAAITLRRIAVGNRAPLPEPEQLVALLTKVRAAELKQLSQLNNDGVVCQLVRTPRMRNYMVITIFCWLGSGMAYFGLSFEVTQLSSNRYVANCLSGLVEVPACVLPWLAATRWGRRPSVCCLYLLAAATILLTGATSDWRTLMALGLVGKFAVTAAFCLLYIYTPEYIPTTVRTVGFGVASVAARVGSAVSPFVIDGAAQLHHSASSLIFGSVCLLAALAALLLPETAGRQLPETVAAVELGAWRSERAERVERLTDLLPKRRSGNTDEA